MRTVLAGIVLLLTINACDQGGEKNPSIVTRDGIEIAYTRCGDADTTLLFVHGWCINKEYWQPQLAYFCPRYQVVAIDLPGFGQSGKDRTNWDFNEYTEDIRNVIEKLKLMNVILIGHSMSGDIVLNVSNKYPRLIAGIVGVDNLHEPGSPMTNDQQKEMNEFFGMMSTRFDSTVITYMKPSLFQSSTDTTVVNRVMHDILTTDAVIATAVLRAEVDMYQKGQALMQGLSHPLFLVNSDVVPTKSDSLRKYCKKGFGVELVRGTGHYPMIEKSGEFNLGLERVIGAIGK